MPIYTLYPCKDGGLSDTFEALDLPSDETAGEFAFQLLQRHPSCSHVVVWRAERRVLTYWRSDGEADCNAVAPPAGGRP
ncbi:MAG: hypothetical protein JWQ52_622 [Phenylobacterium sp.]|nr:hypothetical protein [Phenylobacterium sp.]